VRDAARVARYTSGPIFIIGDLNQAGDGYARAVLDGLRRHRVRNNLILELFDAPPADYFQRVSDAVPYFNFEMSPETHDDAIRRRGGKLYTSQDVIDTVGGALRRGASKFDLYFMIGLTGQTPSSVMDTVEWAAELMDRFDQRLATFISPLAPFLDPGSLAYENADKYGYKILFKDFASYRDALVSPTWKQCLNYETQWMTRDELVDVTYQAGRALNRHKFRRGRIDERTYREIDLRIGRAIDLMARFDALLAANDPELLARERARLKPEADAASAHTVNAPHEIKWRVLGRNFHYGAILRDMLWGPRN
jgi:radical SAM superfamily enzyme YgiQ (UPF0313 family)